MQKAEYTPWSENNFPSMEKLLLVPPNRKEPPFPMGNVGGYVGGNRLASMFGNLVNVIAKVWSSGNQDGTKFSTQLTEPVKGEKQETCRMQVISVSSSIPIFETKKDGTGGRLTVPLDYESTPDDMTPAGVYVEDVPCTGRDTARPDALRKRRKQTTKGNQQMASGRSNSSKGRGKNRKDKKRSNLRMDICNEYWDADFEDAIGSNGAFRFSPSSIGSFHDAVQDSLVIEKTYMREAKPCGVGPSSAAEDISVTRPSLQNSAARCNSTTPTATGVEEGVKPKCDIESAQDGFIVLTDLDVYTTPSGSPARRRPSRGKCECSIGWWISWLDEQQDDEEEADEEEEEEEDDEDDCISDDGVEGDYDDDDCDSILFFEKPDDIDDTCSSSGFEERKVRFNLKPTIHVIRAWDFAYRQARKGDWIMAARDRERFRKRIDDLEPVLGPALEPTVRAKIYAERFSSRDGKEKGSSTLKTESKEQIPPFKPPRASTVPRV